MKAPILHPTYQTRTGVSRASWSLTCSFAHATQKTLNGVVLPSAPRNGHAVSDRRPLCSSPRYGIPSFSMLQAGFSSAHFPSSFKTHTHRCCVRVSFRTESPLRVSLYLHCTVAQSLREAILDKLTQDLTVSYSRHIQPVPPSFCIKPYGAHALLAPAQRERQRKRARLPCDPRNRGFLSFVREMKGFEA